MAPANPNPNSDDDNNNNGNNNPFTVLNRIIESDVRAILSQAEEVRSQLFGFNFNSSIRPHIEKSLEEYEKDRREGWRRFGDRYERSTNPERRAIEPRTGTQAEKERMEYEKRRLEEDGFDPQAWHGWWGWPSTGYGSRGYSHDRDRDQDQEEHSGRRWGRCKHERDQRRKELQQEQEQARLQRERQAHVQSKDDHKPEQHPFEALFSLEPFLAHHLGLGQHGVSAWRPNDQYLKKDPYSPLQLEKDGVTARKGQHWRNAFEDLLVEANTDGLPTGHRPAAATTTAGRQGWIEHIMRIGMSAPLIGEATGQAQQPDQRQDRPPIAPSSSLASTKQGKGREADTELELYEYFLEGLDTYNQQSHSPSTSHGTSQATSPPTSTSIPTSVSTATSTPTPKPQRHQSADSTQVSSSIIGTLTTKTTQTLPDGTQITKKVLRRKFADGSETTEEEEDVRRAATAAATVGQSLPRRRIRDNTSTPSITAAVAEKRNQTQKAAEKNEAKGGWFWSS